MVKKYIIYRVPIEADKGFKEKKKRIEKNIKVWTGKTVNVPMTKILTAVANNPVELGEGQVIRLIKKKKKKK